MHEVLGNYFSFLKKSRKGRLIMIPIEKTVKMSNQISFRIPSLWREELNFIQGNIAKIHIRNNAILINACNVYTTEVSSTIGDGRSEEHTSELQSRGHLVCRLLLEKKKILVNETK